MSWAQICLPWVTAGKVGAWNHKEWIVKGRKKESWWIGILDRNYSRPQSLIFLFVSAQKKNTELKLKKRSKFKAKPTSFMCFLSFSCLTIRITAALFLLFNSLHMGLPVVFCQTRHGYLKAFSICGAGLLLSNIPSGKQRSPWWQRCTCIF